jgi:hypothetical protein
VIAGHVDGESVLAVGGLDDRDRVLDRLLLVRLEPDRDEHRVAVLGDEALALVGRDDLRGGARGVELGGELVELVAEGLILREKILVADDDELGRLRLVGLHPVHRPVGLDGLGVVRHRCVGRQPVAEERPDEQEGEDDRGDPGPDPSPGMPGRGACEAFGHATGCNRRQRVVWRARIQPRRNSCGTIHTPS